MKKTILFALGMFLCSLLISQNNQTEIICPCMLEFKFPNSIADGNDLLQAFGGIPILRFEEALVENNNLVCKYATEFAKFVFEGFGFVIDRQGGLSSIPYDLTLTLEEKFLNGWTASRKTVKLPHYHRGEVIYTLQAETGDCYSWSGGLYKSVYNGNQITLKSTFENEARVNNEGTGFITADTQAGLFSSEINSNALKDASMIGKQNPETKRIPDSTNQTVTKVIHKEFDKNAKIKPPKTSKKKKKKNI